MLPLKNYEQFYTISKGGRIYSLRKYKFLKHLIKPNGYHQVYLTGETEEQNRWWYIHRLVMSTYGPAQPSGTHEINHIDFNKSHNYIDNLEWLTHRENMIEARRMGLWTKPCGRKPGSKMSEESKKKMSLAKLKPVTATNIENVTYTFGSVGELCEALKIDPRSFSSHVDKGTWCKRWRFKTMQKEE